MPAQKEVPRSPLGERIQALRESKTPTWSQERLARELKVSRGTIFNVETGRTRPDLATLVKLAQVLDADLADLADLVTGEAGAA